MSKPSADVVFNVAAQRATAQLTMFTNAMKKQLRELGQEKEKLGKTGARPFQGWADDIGRASLAMLKIAGPLGAAMGIVELIRKECQQIVELGREARAAQVPYQAKLLGLANSLPANEDPAVALKAIDQLIMNSKVADRGALVDVIAAASGKAAGMPSAERAKIAIEVAEENPQLMQNGGQAAGIVAAQVALGQVVFGANGATVDSQQRLIHQGLSNSAVDDIGLYSENLFGKAPGMKNAFNVSQLDALAAMHAVGNTIMDTEGTLTEQAVTSMFGAMKKGEQRFGFKLPNDLAGKLEFLQSNDPKANEFRKFVSGAYMEGFELTDAERAEMSAADLNKALDPHITGLRTKTIHAVLGLFQPKGKAEHVGGAKHNLQVARQELGLVAGKTEAQNYAALDEAWDTSQQKLKDTGLFNELHADAGGKGVANVFDLTGNAPYGQYFDEGPGGHQELMRKSGVPWSVRRVRKWAAWWSIGKDDPTAANTAMANEQLERMAFLAGPQANQEFQTWRPGGLDDAEAARFGIGKETQAQINALLVSIESLVEQIKQQQNGQPQKVEIVNQPPAQPRPPAAEALRQRVPAGRF